MKADTKNNSYAGTENTEKYGQGCSIQTEFRNLSHRKGLCLQSEARRQSRSEKSGKYTGNQGRIVHDTNADYLHGKDSSCQRCPKKSCKACAHSTHNRYLFILFIQLHHFADQVSQTSSQLKGCPFPPQRSTDTVTQYRRNKNQRRSSKGYLFIGRNSFNHHVRSTIFFFPASTIQPDNQKTCCRHEKNRPMVTIPHPGCPGYAVSKYRSYCAYSKANHNGNQGPFDKIMYIQRQRRSPSILAHPRYPHFSLQQNQSLYTPLDFTSLGRYPASFKA